MYSPDELLLEAWVSRERLTRYRQASGPTSELYFWNAKLAAAYFEIIGHVEVLLRNVFHSRLFPHSLGGRWYRDDRYPFSAQAKRDIKTAISRASRGEQNELPGKVVAELSFGFWRFLLSNRYQSTVWPIVAPGFRGGARHERSRSQLEETVLRVYKLRNRIAHHEPIFHQSSVDHLVDIYRIAAYVDRRAEDTVRGLCRVPKVLIHDKTA